MSKKKEGDEQIQDRKEELKFKYVQIKVKKFESQENKQTIIQINDISAQILYSFVQGEK